MSFLSLFSRPSSAHVARERLQILLAHERVLVGQSDLITILRDEILAVIAKHVAMHPYHASAMREAETASRCACRG